MVRLPGLMAPRMDLERDEISGPCQAGWTGRGASSLTSYRNHTTVGPGACALAAISPFGHVLSEREGFSNRFAGIERTINTGV